jgi:chemotaxis protein CheZ
MKMEEPSHLAPAQPLTVSPEVFQQIGNITRLLHDALQQLGVMPALEAATEGLPEARSRLHYIATKTAEAAEKVLNSVDLAKAEQARMSLASGAMADALALDPLRAVSGAAVLDYVKDMQAATARVDAHLTDIMLAQDFHDLTGQVVGRVVTLAEELEDSLVRLLLSAAPPERRPPPDPAAMDGPVVDAKGRVDVVSSQGEVDDLLASLGF